MTLEDWRRLDWDLPTAVIARTVNRSNTLVAVMRRKLGESRPLSWWRRHSSEKWKTVDWSKPDREIAEQLDVSIPWVNVVRHRQGKAGARPPKQAALADAWLRRNKSRVKRMSIKQAAAAAGVSYEAMWNAARSVGVRFPREVAPSPWRTTPINWELRNKDIARQVGVTPERARQARLEFGHPRSTLTKLKRAEIWLKANRHRIASMTRSDAAREAQVDYATMGHTAKRLGYVLRREPRPLTAAWRRMPINWMLPNRDLRDIWKLPEHRLASARYVFPDECPPARWHRSRDRDDPHYQRTLSRERAKAAKYWSRVRREHHRP